VNIVISDRRRRLLKTYHGAVWTGDFWKRPTGPLSLCIEHPPVALRGRLASSRPLSRESAPFGKVNLRTLEINDVHQLRGEAAISIFSILVVWKKAG